MTKLLKYILRRLSQIFPVVFGVTALVMFLLRVSTPDPGALIVGQRAGGQQLTALRADLGLDLPWYRQFCNFIYGVVTGDWGQSYMTKTPVLPELLDRAAATIELSLLTMAVSLAFGILLGTIGAVTKNKLWSWLIAAGTSLGLSIPGFGLSLLLVTGFGVTMRLVPVAGRVGFELAPTHHTGLLVLDSLFTRNWSALVSVIHHLLLPTLTLSIPTGAIIARITRLSLLEVVSHDYIRTARAKGLRSKTVVYKHALRNGLPPVLATIGIQWSRLLSGAMVVETVFAWPGLGLLLVDAVQSGDFPIIQGIVLITAFAYTVVSLVVDVLCALTLPAVRYI